MDKINKIIYNSICLNEVNEDELMNILYNLTNMERNIVFNKLYFCNSSNSCYTILQYIHVCYSYRSEILIDLLKRYKDNININVKNSDGNTLLYNLTIDKDIEILKLIHKLYKDVNVNILNNKYENILYYTIIYTNAYKNENIVKFLLENGIIIQYKLLIRIINNIKKYEKYINILLEYLHKNDKYDYILEELYKYVVENKLINEDNKEFYDKLFIIKSNTKSAAKKIE